MRILVTTSDQQLNLLIPFYTLFNRYWPDQDVTILGFDDSNIPPLPDNFEYVSMGKQSDFGRNWTDPLIPYIESVEEEYFVVMMGDFLLTDHIDTEGLRLLEDEIISGDADKAMLDTHLTAYTDHYKKGIGVLLQNAPYRASLHPSIWTKEYFKKQLRTNCTAWDFETKNMDSTMNDGATIIVPQNRQGPPDWAYQLTDPRDIALASAKDDVLKVTNVYQAGRAIPRWDNKNNMPFGCTNGILKEDILLICSYTDISIVYGSGSLSEQLEDNKRYC